MLHEELEITALAAAYSVRQHQRHALYSGLGGAYAASLSEIQICAVQHKGHILHIAPYMYAWVFSVAAAQLLRRLFICTTNDGKLYIFRHTLRYLRQHVLHGPAAHAAAHYDHMQPFRIQAGLSLCLRLISFFRKHASNRYAVGQYIFSRYAHGLEFSRKVRMGRYCWQTHLFAARACGIVSSYKAGGYRHIALFHQPRHQHCREQVGAYHAVVASGLYGLTQPSRAPPYHPVCGGMFFYIHRVLFRIFIPFAVKPWEIPVQPRVPARYEFRRAR